MNLVSDISHDNKYLAASPIFSPIIELRLIPSGDVERKLIGLNSPAKSIHFSNDSTKLIAYSAQGKLIIWDTESGQILFEKKTEQPKQLTFSTDSKFTLQYHDDKAEHYTLKLLGAK